MKVLGKTPSTRARILELSRNHELWVYPRREMRARKYILWVGEVGIAISRVDALRLIVASKKGEL